ncbi:hypothetical protein O5D80_003251 [Batrachochytrium dendrobatidis]|nr:hypothetical protein O5D80_003251 [Batrachochytrium dendrobatidis]
MKFSITLLSSILLACSITIANPIDPSATTDVESSIFPDLPSATTDVEASIFPDLPSATTDVEASIFPDLPSATTDVEASIRDSPSATTDVEASIFPDLPSATTDVEASIFPDLPSATTSTEASTSPTPNPNGIGLGGLDPLPDSIKELLEKYEKKKQNRIEQKKKCELLRFQYDDQHKHVKDLKRKLYLLEHKARGNGDGSEYDSEIQKTKHNLEAQESKLNDLGSRYHDCDSKHDSLKFGLRVIGIKLVEIVFGKPWDPKLFEQQLLFIDQHPSIQGYFGGSGNKGKSSGPQPSGSGSPGQGAPSNRRNGFSKLMHNVGSFFGRPK